MAETKDAAQKAPIKLQIVADDALGYCDPETGVCTVAAPAPKTDEQAGAQPEKRADEKGQSR